MFNNTLEQIYLSMSLEQMFHNNKKFVLKE